MKHKFFKRISTFLLATIMIISTNAMAFAAGEHEVCQPKEDLLMTIPASEDGTTIVEYDVNIKDLGITSLSTNADEAGGNVPSNSTKSFTLHKSQSSALSYLVVNSVSKSTSGALFIYLYRPNGSQVSDDWIMGVNEAVRWIVLSPQSGNWKLRVVASGTNAVVNVYATWSNIN